MHPARTCARLLGSSLPVLACALLVACELPGPRDGEIGCLVDAQASTTCAGYVAPPPPDAGGDGAVKEGGTPRDGGAEFFGKACAVQSDCGGQAPICVAVLGYCTNAYCGPGELNDGICPAATFTCYPAGNGNPSACIKK